MERRIFCERARAWAALQSDGELSTFEQRLLDAHVARCAECRAFALSVAAVTGALRDAPLVPLSHPVSIRGLHRPRRFAPRRAVYSAGAAAAAAVMALAVGLGMSVRAGEKSVAPSIPVIVVSGPDERQDVRNLRELRRVQLVTDIAPASSPRVTHFGSNAT
jgi:predicted anti-sigma-YlaC factor YlaD